MKAIITQRPIDGKIPRLENVSLKTVSSREVAAFPVCIKTEWKV